MRPKKTHGTPAKALVPWMGQQPAVEGCDCHLCRPERFLSPHHRTTVDRVLSHGWEVQAVTDATSCTHPDHDHSHDRPGGGDTFAYTIGLGHRCGHPELLMTGLDVRVMHHRLELCARLVLEGRRLAPGDGLEGLVPGFAGVVEAVGADEAAATLLGSGWFHRRPPEAVRLVWPPAAELRAGRWPADRMALVCSHVVEGGEPIQVVSRHLDVDGEWWEVTCDQGHPDEELLAVHLHHLVEASPSMRELADLGFHEVGWRDGAGEPWRRVPLRPQ